MNVLLKEDGEILLKGLKISLSAAATPAAAPMQGSTTAADMLIELTELSDELRAEAGDAVSPEAVAARWGDVRDRQSLFDRAIVGRLSISEDVPVVDFLIGCFARCNDLRARKGSAVTAELAEIFDYITGLCISYSSIALLNPSMFPQPADAEAEGVLRLLSFLRADRLPSGYLTRLAERLQEEDSLAELLPLFAKLVEELNAKTMNIMADFSPAYRALHALVREKPIGTLFATDPAFLPTFAVNGALLQMTSRLGPFFGLSCFPSDPAVGHPPSPFSACLALNTVRPACPPAAFPLVKPCCACCSRSSPTTTMANSVFAHASP